MMDFSIPVRVPSRLVVEGSKAAVTDDVALDEFALYPEIWGLSSRSAPGQGPAALPLASASPVNRPPSSGLFCSRRRRS